MEKEDSPYRNFISKPEVSFWVPLISAATVIAMSWFNLSSRIDLLTQKMNIVIENQEKVILSMKQEDEKLHTEYVQMQTQWGQLSQRVTRLEK